MAICAAFLIQTADETHIDHILKTAAAAAKKPPIDSAGLLKTRSSVVQQTATPHDCKAFSRLIVHRGGRLAGSCTRRCRRSSERSTMRAMGRRTRTTTATRTTSCTT